jgi:hypothetical protein
MGIDRLYVVSQFASAANRRILHFLELDRYGVETILVRQDYDDLGRAQEHLRTIRVRKWKNPLAVLDTIGLRTLRARIDARVYFPTPAILFARAAFSELSRALLEDRRAARRSAVVIVTPPHDLAMLAPDLRRRFPEVRILIDWQDLWSDDVTYAGRTASRHLERLRQGERDAAAAADVNIVTNPNALERLSMLLATDGAPLPRVIAIGHAFDPEEVAAARAARRPKIGGPRLRLGFYGNLFKPPKVPGAALLDVLGAAHRAGCRFELAVVGDRTLERQPDKLAGLPFPTEVVPRLTHLEAVADAARADWLVLLLGRTQASSAIMHAKLPMYFATGTPILAFVPKDSYAAQAVIEAGAGQVLDLDEDPIERLIGVLKGPVPTVPDAAQMLDRAELFGLQRMHRQLIDALGLESVREVA